MYSGNKTRFYSGKNYKSVIRRYIKSENNTNHYSGLRTTGLPTGQVAKTLGILLIEHLLIHGQLRDVPRSRRR